MPPPHAPAMLPLALPVLPTHTPKHSIHPSCPFGLCECYSYGTAKMRQEDQNWGCWGREGQPLRGQPRRALQVALLIHRPADFSGRGEGGRGARHAWRREGQGSRGGRQMYRVGALRCRPAAGKVTGPDKGGRRAHGQARETRHTCVHAWSREEVQKRVSRAVRIGWGCMNQFRGLVPLWMCGGVRQGLAPQQTTIEAGVAHS